LAALDQLRGKGKQAGGYRSNGSDLPDLNRPRVNVQAARPNERIEAWIGQIS
jgi:hypothetical protein